MSVSWLRHMYRYLTASRQRFLASLRDLGWDEATRNRGATWDSMHGIYVHMLEVEDSWLHYDIPGVPWPHGARPPEAFDSFDAVAAYDREVAEKTEALLEGLTDTDLARAIDVEGWGEMTVETILLHTFVDEVAHLGELVCLLWQLAVKPPWVNWGDFVLAGG